MLAQPGSLLSRRRRVVSSAPVADWPAGQVASNITRTTYTTGSAVFSWTMFSAVGIPSGCLALAFIGYPAGTPVIDTATSGTDWTQVVTSVGSTTRSVTAYSWLNTGGSTVNRTLAFSPFGGRGARGALLIIPPSGPGVTLNASGGGAASGFSLAIDPGSFDAGASRKHLWIACGAMASGVGFVDVLSAPASYTDFQNLKQPTAASSQAGLYTAERFLEAQTENPGAFTIDGAGNQNWAAATVAVWETV